MKRLFSAGAAAIVISLAVAPAYAQQGLPNIPAVGGYHPQGQGGEILRPRGGGAGGGGGAGRSFQRGGGGGWQGGGARAQNNWRGGGQQYGERGNDGWRRHHDRNLGLGLGGLAAGALIGGAIASQTSPDYGYGYGYPAPVYGDPAYGPPPDQDYEDAYTGPVTSVGGDATGYCAQRFKSYDVASGTYLGFDGMRHPCP